MRSVTKDNITETFLGYFGDDTDPRLKEIMTSLSKHLHEFARETNLTHKEWQKGLDILRGAGAITTPERDEFVLMSDVLGLSSLVDMVNSPEKGTNSSVLGPFHISNAPAMELGADMRGDYEGELILVTGRVLDVNDNPIAGATLDIWQTAPNGLYSSQDPEQDIYSFHALFTTGSDGTYRFTTVRPVSYTVPTDDIIKADGFRTLVTEVFPDDDPYLDEDTVFGVRSDLVMTYVKQPADTFPAEGYALSGKVEEEYSRVDFDLILSAETSHG